MGTLGLAIPKLRKGTYLPQWLFEPRRRAERALEAVVAECYVMGVSTRKVEGIAHALGIEGLSKTQVSEMARSLDAAIETFRRRPLDEGPYPYLWLGALVVKSRELGRVVNVAVLVERDDEWQVSRRYMSLETIQMVLGRGSSAPRSPELPETA